MRRRNNLASNRGAISRDRVTYALTIFLGAMLLFLVQPLMGKYVLPWFGGGPGVWTVCLLFFQALLLAGYFYAHVLTTRLRPKAQAAVHVALLAAAICFLPIVPRAPTSIADAPALQLLLLLARTVGMPYFALSATAPLLQRWFHRTEGAALPYRLYALSNVGALLGLAAYPLLLEPRWPRATQAWMWSGGMVLFAALIAACGWRVWCTAGDGGDLMEPAPDVEWPVIGAGVASQPGRSRSSFSFSKALRQTRERERLRERERAPTQPDSLPAPPTRGARIWWITLPAIASLLLAAITSKLTVDVAPVPFLWVLPLALYLLSFVLCFDHPRWYARRLFAGLLVPGTLAVALLWYLAPPAPLGVQLLTYAGMFFVAVMVCHGELHRLRPAPARLTEFYLCVAAGGVAGTLFVAVIAPRLFSRMYEVQLGLVAVIAARGLLGSSGRVRAGALVFAAWLAIAFVIIGRQDRAIVVAATRNFYGALRVLDRPAPEPRDRRLEFWHGVTLHGTQFLDPERSRWPTSYFGHETGIGIALDQLAPPTGRSIGVVGLGAGTLASYGRPGDRMTFYEIDPAVIALAQAPFRYLAQSAAEITLVPGDGRLALAARAARGNEPAFDVLVLDAFSSDAVPIHLLTTEAMEIYLRLLKPGGIIAVNFTNRLLDLRGVLAGLARRHDFDFVFVENAPKANEYWLYPSRWCLLTRDRTLLSRVPTTPGVHQRREQQFRPLLWTDDHSSLRDVLPP